MRMKKWKVYALSVLLPLLVGGLSALLTQNGMDAFDALRKPALSPPMAVFPIVWSILYILMGLSAALIWETESPQREEALFLYALQLFMNFWWSIFFFAWEMRLLAFVWLLGLLGVVVAMVRQFYRIRPAAAWLNVPYILWLILAAWLNLSVWFLNR